MNTIKMIIALLIVIVVLNPGYASQGKYAVLIFGGYGGAGDTFDARLYVREEMAYMFEILIENCDFENADIWVHNLDGVKNSSSHYDLFKDSTGIGTVSHYYDAEFSTVDSVFDVLNSALNSHSQNLVLIYICGHQSQSPDGTNNTRQWYKFEDAAHTDSAFAKIVKDKLLEGTYDVNSKTHVVFVTGFCASYGFYNDSPDYDELYDVVDYISYAATDTQNTDSAVQAGPPPSFMKYWVDQYHTDSNVSFDVAFDSTFAQLFRYHGWDDQSKSTPLDYPWKSNPGGWDDDWSLLGVVVPDNPTSLSVTGYSNPKAYLSWTDNSDNETGFKIYRSVNGGAFAYKATVGSNVTTYNDYSISNGYEYDYKVAAYRTLSGWTSYSDYTNEDDLPLICWIYGPTELEYKVSGTWYARRAGDDGTPSYQWWKSFDEENWTAIGTGSDVTFSMGKVTVYLKLRVTVGGTSVYDYHTVLPGDAKSNEFDTSINVGNLSPLHFNLAENYPNPFNPETKIRFVIPEKSQVNLQIYNLKGQIVATLINRTMDAGYHTATFNAESLPSGIYFYKLVAGEFTDIKRMLLIK